MFAEQVTRGGTSGQAPGRDSRQTDPDGRTTTGVLNQGFWFLDYDGDYACDGGATDKIVRWGRVGHRYPEGGSGADSWAGEGQQPDWRSRAPTWSNGRSGSGDSVFQYRQVHISLRGNGMFQA